MAETAEWVLNTSFIDQLSRGERKGLGVDQSLHDESKYREALFGSFLGEQLFFYLPEPKLGISSDEQQYSHISSGSINLISIWEFSLTH